LEVEAMSHATSPSTQTPYGVARVTAVWELARSSFYAARQRQAHPREPKKRGPKVLSDPELLAEIQKLLAAPAFPGEGYRKIWARLRFAGVRTSKERVLRLMRENQLLSPARSPEPVRTNPHEGTIIAEAPNQMWGTDATATFTEPDGAVTIFAVIDHCSADCVGIHAVKKASRFEALEPIRQGMKEHFGGFFRRHRRRPATASRSRQRLHERRFSERNQISGYRTITGFRSPARRKRLH
jgi:putative transposase